MTDNNISGDRDRTNLLKNLESRLIEYLCERMPAWVKPDLLTAVGLFGSLVVFF